MSRRRAGAALRLSILVLVSLLLGGCWHAIPLDRRGLVSMLGIDLGPGTGYTVTAAVVNPTGLPPPGPSGQGGGQGSSPVLLRSATGTSVAAAIHRLTGQSYLRLDFTHLHAVLVSEPLARAGLAGALQYPIRSPEYNQTAWLLVVRGESAAHLLQQSQHIQPRPAEVLANTVRWSRTHTPFAADRVFSFAKEVATAGESFETAGVAVGTSPGGERTRPFVIAGSALFSGERLAGWLDGDAALGAAVLSGRASQLVLDVPWLQGRLQLELVGVRRHLALARRAPRPALDVSLSLEAHLAAAPGPLTDYWSSPALLADMESTAATAIQADAEAAVRHAQQVGADVFGFGEDVRLADPGYWHRVRAHWAGRSFAELPVGIAVRVRVTSVGETICPLEGGC